MVFDVQKAIDYVAENGTLAGFNNVFACEELTPAEKVLELDVDILVPAALEGQITDRNVKNVKAKLIAECANWTNNAGSGQGTFREWSVCDPRLPLQRRRRDGILL